jgi:predicted Fe-S protein YdhL (DUF1289 family)
MTEQSKTLIDNGNETVTADEQSPDNRHVANAKAAEIVSAITKAESALSVTAKEHGAAMFRANKQDNVSLDVLIGESKLAAGFATLGATEAGKKAKSRLNVYFSNYRLVAERWEKLSDEQREGVLNGTVSAHYLAGLFRDADRKAEKEAKAAAAAGEAAASPDAANANGDGTPESGLTMAQLATELLQRWTDATDDEREEALDAMALLVDAVNASTEETGEIETVEIAKAA